MNLKKYTNIKEYLKEKPEVFLAGSMFGSLIIIMWIVGNAYNNGELIYVIAPLIIVSYYVIFKKLGQWQNEEKEQLKKDMFIEEKKEVV